jgi:serine/threonine-protein kinase
VPLEPEPPEDGESVAERKEEPAFEALLRRVAAAPRVPAELLETAEMVAGAPAPHLWSAPRLPTAGDVVDGRYRIEGELGRGGMGVVFSARNLRTGRDVALKWMLPRGLPRSASERSEGAERFEREARAVSRIDHPNVVRVYDVGGDPAAPYLVMERLHGETLRARLARGQLDWDEALSLLLPAMSGVAAAHRAGVVHRDLKPDNVFVCAAGVKVLDFGVSRIGGDEDHTTLTRTGTMLGTPAYMPLEQLRGTRQIDERTDVYALGVILYEALSGRLPFDAHTAADQAVLLATRKPQPLGDLVPTLRGPRADVVMRALTADPAGRYESVESMAQALGGARRDALGKARGWLWLALSLCLLAGLLAAAFRAPAPASPRISASPARVSGAASLTSSAPSAEPRPVQAVQAPIPASPASPPEDARAAKPIAPVRALRHPKDALSTETAPAARAAGELELSADQFEARPGRADASSHPRSAPVPPVRPALRREDF